MKEKQNISDNIGDLIKKNLMKKRKKKENFLERLHNFQRIKHHDENEEKKKKYAYEINLDRMKNETKGNFLKKNIE